MSKKANHVQAAPQPTTQATAAPAVAGDGAAVVPASAAGPAQAATPRDEHHGQGGHYEMRDGKRVLVQRTDNA